MPVVATLLVIERRVVKVIALRLAGTIIAIGVLGGIARRPPRRRPVTTLSVSTELKS